MSDEREQIADLVGKRMEFPDDLQRQRDLDIADLIIALRATGPQVIDFALDDWGGHGHKAGILGKEFIVNGSHFTLFDAEGRGDSWDGHSLVALVLRANEVRLA